MTGPHTLFAGVAQVSILGPLLFFIYINAIVNNIQSSTRLLSDGTSLHTIAETPQIAALTLSSDIGTISHRAGDIVGLFSA